MHEVEEYKGIILGTPADAVLDVMGDRSSMLCSPVVLGKQTIDDVESLIVEWHYAGVVFTLARGSVDDAVYGRLEMYAVQKIQVKE